MNAKPSGSWFRFVVPFFAAVFSVASAWPILASPVSPTTAITRAVTASGAPNVAAAPPVSFVNALASVLVRVKEKNTPAYVSAAIKLRPDLAAQIVTTALRAVRPSREEDIEKRNPCDWLNPIVEAAILAAPNARAAIIKAAIAFEPAARDCIVEAPGEGPPGEGPGTSNAGNINSTAIGTINPGNIGRGRPAASQAGP